MSLYRRSNSPFWWVRFSLSGRRIRVSTRTAHRAEAQEFETALRSRVWRQVQLGQTAHSFQEAVDRYLIETGNRPKDAQRLGWFLQNPAFAELALQNINRDVLDAAKAKLSETLSHSTVNHYLGLVRTVLRRSVEWGWLEHAPKIPMYRVRLPEPRWITRAQFERLVKHLPSHSADLARFAVATGLRRSNITGLTWDRVDLKRGTAYIPGSEAKAGKGIPLPLNAEAVAVLKHWRGRHERWVFVWKGRRITQVTTRAWRRACQEAGLEGLRFHDLRHTWASWQIQSGTPLAVVKDMGGWASLQMVERYGHLDPGHLRRYASRTLVRRRGK